MDDATSLYVHGYDPRESDRLRSQAWSVADLLHRDTRYAPGDVLLEVGCGTGSQTLALARNNPQTRIVSFDRSRRSIAEARARLDEANVTNVELHQADLFSLPFGRGSFDHVFVCFVLEHLPNPREALVAIRHLLKPGGTVTAFEGDHGSAYFHPESPWADRVIGCQVELQRRAGGNPMIGRQLHSLLSKAGFRDVHVSPCLVYVDAGRPDLREAFTRRTFTAMIEGVREQALAAGLIDTDAFDRGIRDLARTAATDGVFCYTFFKAAAHLSWYA